MMLDRHILEPWLQHTLPRTILSSVVRACECGPTAGGNITSVKPLYTYGRPQSLPAAGDGHVQEVSRTGEQLASIYDIAKPHLVGGSPFHALGADAGAGQDVARCRQAPRGDRSRRPDPHDRRGGRSHRARRLSCAARGDLSRSSNHRQRRPGRPPHHVAGGRGRIRRPHRGRPNHRVDANPRPRAGVWHAVAAQVRHVDQTEYASGR